MIANATFNYINEWISSHSLDSINALGTILGSILTIGGVFLFFWKYGSSYYQKINNYIHNKRTTKFYKVINSIEFLLWSNDVLEKIYQKDFFTTIFGLKYPAFFIPCNRPYKYSDFKQVYNKDEILFEEFSIIDNEISSDLLRKIKNNPQTIIDKILQYIIYIRYKSIVKKNIRYPFLPGYMLKKYELDNNRIKHIYVRLGSYYQNIYTSHILEYELYYAYKKTINQPIDMDIIWKYLPYRRQIHANSNNFDVLYSGINRHSLLGIQMFITFYDHNQKEYVTLLLKRSQNVAAKPGYYQFIPSGGFELYEKEKTYNVSVIEENFSFRKVVFREYLEEVFGLDEFKGINLLQNNETTYKILNHPEVLYLLELIDKQEAFMELLGSAVDLVGLRHELSFILRIDNEEFSRKTFTPNDEFDKNKTKTRNIRVKLSELEVLLQNEHTINPTSAALYALVKGSKLYKDLQNNHFKKF